jgi:hypothetical protein
MCIETDKTWVLHYRQGNNPGLTKTFQFNGSLREASQRGLAHCTLMNYSFIFVKPLFTDLQAEETRRHPSHLEGDNNELTT